MIDKQLKIAYVISNLVYISLITLIFSAAIFKYDHSPYWWLFALFMIIAFNAVISIDHQKSKKTNDNQG